mmetsp:Transcript_19594/g.24715  ORF Transcript_19594/g.24715 Transcript_19594/m.24715 type:complete len:257 (-) Transcript_19594:322-1092(-)|eukprot:CAMPEP_0203635048 /NCGR_PEP_ID=MMETSP0088-20131115/1892_1 /ASSEMBLY_ACC=CAM_ASM_001087 /TAXON_ID=426623 /ORGANISM="Chaetoceros affinis, Strain CCMP159" /LENGTH=256 /DNA_ID=CAMNT_0050488797 /DNA_START=47 /DNA_END=817 /DNA_ORIENTATION=+
MKLVLLSFLAASVQVASGFSAVSVPKATETIKRVPIPKNLDVVKAGGYNNVEKLASDPKSELVSLIVNNLRQTDGNGDYTEEGKIDAIIALLQDQGKGFASVTVDGEWSAVLSRQGSKSTRSQKFVGKKQKSASSLSNFKVKAMEFENIVTTPRGNGCLKAVVKYNPIAKGFDKKDGKIVLRRISCDIESATFKYWKFPTLSLPFLKKKGGYLDFLYLDDDIRITKGNRGGLFVHFRPEFLEQSLAKTKWVNPKQG